MINFSFEEAKIKLAEDLNTLKELDIKRSRLNEQLFFMDLQQEVSSKQYKNCLLKIGEYKRKIIEEPQPFRLPNDFHIPDTREDNLMIDELKERLEKSKKNVNEKNEMIFFQNKQKYICDHLLNSIKKTKPEEFQRIDEDSVRNLNNQLNMLQSDQRKLEIEREESYRELWNSVQIEKKLKCQLYSLLKQAKSLAEDRKWHQYTIDENEQKNPNLSFFNNSFSIP